LGSIALELQRHPNIPSGSVGGIEVDVERRAGGAIWVRYRVDAVLDELVLPDPADAARTDGLWQSTCFEMFIRHPDAADYLEFNLSPSSCWAAYHFDDYRSGMKDQSIPAAPAIYLDASATHLALETALILPGYWNEAALTIGLSAVIETTDDTKSYWALAHPPGQPDFHHPDCFALTLPAPDAS
jgi:hypothetical protein